MTLQEVVRDKYAKRYKETQEIIINGVRDWEAYRFSVGYLRGMWDLMEDIYPLLRDPDELMDEQEGR